MSDLASQFLAAITEWAKTQTEISELLLVGSHAIGKATADSDIDLVFICANPAAYLEGTSWIEQFGKVKDQSVEDWGKVESLRVWYQNGLEVEYGIASWDWLAEPLEVGTLEVLNHGYEALLDKQNRLVNLRPKI